MIERKYGVWVGALLLCAGVGCNGDDRMGSVDAGSSDSGAIEIDGNAGDIDAPMSSCEATIPTPPFGVLEGRKFEPLTLDSCDGNAYEFYNQDYCEARLTVVSIAAGWCMPCIMESGMLTNLITRVYGPQGVRVIQIPHPDRGLHRARRRVLRRLGLALRPREHRARRPVARHLGVLPGQRAPREHHRRQPGRHPLP